MLRAARADSSDIVLWITDPSSPSSVETSFRELDDVFLQTQTRIWLGEVLHTRFDEEVPVADLLADGELLFKVSKVVWKMLLTAYDGTKYSKGYIYEPSKSGGRYMPYSNVDAFLKICQILGLTGIDLFSPSDVVEKRNLRRVCMCIRSFSKKARSKCLNVPDFDVVTYTLAMPTDMVGYIRRSLEQYQCSSSSSNSSMGSRDKRRQRIQGADCRRPYDLFSEGSDEAESNFRVFEFDSPTTNTPYDVRIMPGFLEENSPQGDSVVEENLLTAQDKLLLNVQDKYMLENIQIGDSAGSIGPINACTMESGNRQFMRASLIASSPSCLECQLDLNARTYCTHLREVELPISSYADCGDICSMDHCYVGVDASCARDLSKEFNRISVTDSEEKLTGQISNNPILWQQSLQNTLPKSMPTNSCSSIHRAQDEVPKTSLVSSDSSQVTISDAIDTGGSECRFLLQETINGTCTCMPDLCAGRPKRHELTSPPEKAYTTTACFTSSDSTVERNDCFGHKAASVLADNSVIGNTLTEICCGCNIGASDSIPHAIDNGNSDLSNADGVHSLLLHPGSVISGSNLCYGILECAPACNFSCKVGSSEFSSTGTLNSVSNDVAILACQDHFDVNDELRAVNAHFLEFQNVEGTELTLEVSVGSHSNDSTKEKEIISSLPAISSTEQLMDETLPKRCNMNLQTYDMDRSSSTNEDLSQDNTSNGFEKHPLEGNLENIIEEEGHNLLIQQKQLFCLNFQMYEDMERMAKPLFIKEMVAENVNCSLKNNLRDSNDCQNNSELEITEGCADNGWMRDLKCSNPGYSCLPQVNSLEITSTGTNEGSFHEVECAVIGHPFVLLPYEAFFVSDAHQRDPSAGKCNDKNPSLEVLDEDKIHQADLSVSNHKSMPSLDSNDVSTESRKMSEFEMHLSENGVIEFSADSSWLDIPSMNDRCTMAVNKIKSDNVFPPELVSLNNLVHHNSVPNTGIEFDCLSVPSPGNLPCSMPGGMESTNESYEGPCRSETYSQHLVDEAGLQVGGIGTTHGVIDSAGNTNKDKEKQEGALTSEGIGIEKDSVTDHKPRNRILLKSLAGGVTLFSGVLLLFHLRRKGGKDKLGETLVHAKIPKPSQSQDRQPKGKVGAVYPGDRLKL